MAIDKEVSRRWRRRIRDVLNTTWDPIGGCPEDEYDTYVGKVAAMIREGTTDAELVAYLRWVELEYMGISLRDDLDDRLQFAVSEIRAIGFMN